MFYSCFKPA
jgi:hypothetical protein